MSSSNQQAGTEQTVPLLVDYLLADSPARVIIISGQGQLLDWPQTASGAPDVITAGNLDEACNEQERVEDDEGVASRHCVAVLDLDGPGGDVSQLLGRAVRLFPARLIACTRSAELADSQLFAFGFRKLDVIGLSSSDTPMRWFEYRLSQYKPSPDWLNARFWANPERFDVVDDPDIYCDDDELDDEDE